MVLNAYFGNAVLQQKSLWDYKSPASSSRVIYVVHWGGRGGTRSNSLRLRVQEIGEERGVKPSKELQGLAAATILRPQARGLDSFGLRGSRD